MGADSYAWVPERAREAARRVRLAFPPCQENFRRRGLVFGSVWFGEGRWCYVDSGTAALPTAEDIEGFDTEGLVGDLVAVSGFPTVAKTPRADGTVYLGKAVVTARYVALVEELWPDAVWRSRGEREPVAAYSGPRPVALVAPLALRAPFGGPAMVSRQEPSDTAQEQAVKLAELEREVRRGEALRQEIERLAEQGEGYASARELRRALALEEPARILSSSSCRDLVSFAGSSPRAVRKHDHHACISFMGEPAPEFVGADGCPWCKNDVARALALEGSE